MRQLKTLFKSIRDRGMSQKTANECVDRFNNAVKRYKRQRRIDRLNNVLDSIGNFLFPQPNPAYARI